MKFQVAALIPLMALGESELKLKVLDLKTRAVETALHNARKVQDSEEDERVNELIDQLCDNPLDDLTFENFFDLFDGDLIKEYISCVEGVFDDLLEGCLTDLPTLGGTAQCFLDLSSEESEDKEAQWFQGSSTGSINFRDTFNADSAEEKYGRCGEFVETNSSVDEDVCEELFGNESDTSSFACFQLLANIEVDDFEAFLEEEFLESDNCQNFSALVGEDSATSFVENFFFSKFAFFDDFDGSSTQDTLNEKFEEFGEVFNNCSELDEGSLEQSLVSRFITVSSTTTSAAAVASLNIVGAAATMAIMYLLH